MPEAKITETGPNIKELLSLARGPIGADISLDFGVPNGPTTELGLMLSQKNGFYLYNAGIHVFHAGESTTVPDLFSWNNPETWQDYYGKLAEDIFCFAQDIFGVQHAIADNGTKVVTFDPETGELTTIGTTLEDWAAWLQDDPDVNGTAAFAKFYQDSQGALKPNERLVPLQLFNLGGEYAIENLVVRDCITAMRIRGPIAVKLENMPDGTKISLEVDGYNIVDGL